MSDEKRPWFPLYADAYSGDKHLEACSPLAECLLVRMMVMSHNGEPYGYVTNGGEALTIDHLVLAKSAAIVLGKMRQEDVPAAIQELMEAKRIGWDPERKAYFVPKMVRIGNQSAVCREHGRRGGNPALITDPIGKATADGTPDRTDWQKVVNDWNELAKANGLAGIQAMTDERKRKYKIRMASMPEFWAILKRQIPALAEPVKTSHWMTFDFCVASDQNLTKIMEGKYRDRAVPSGSTRPKAARPTFDAIVAEVVTEVEKRPEIDRDNYVRSLRDKYGKAIQDQVRDVLAFRKEMAARNAETPKVEET